MNEDSAAAVSAFLSDSRCLAERVARHCKHSNCAFLCTGIAGAPLHCCRLCARSPGQHGPKCARQLLPCSSPGCRYAVTGLTASHCCRKCAAGEDHGPNCWHLLAVNERIAGAEADDEAADDLICVEAQGLEEAQLSLAAAEEQDMQEETEEERALRIVLDAKIEGNEMAIQSNDELIRRLREEAGLRSAG